MAYNKSMNRIGNVVKKIAAAAIGVPLLIIGIILIPLPGPGLLTCFLALFILSLAFERPKKHFEKSKAALRKIYEEAKKRADAIEQKGRDK